MALKNSGLMKIEEYLVGYYVKVIAAYSQPYNKTWPASCYRLDNSAIEVQRDSINETSAASSRRADQPAQVRGLIYSFTVRA